MESKKTKGKQKIEMKKIDKEVNRLVTFSKRRSGINKKASELVTLCGAEVGVVVFSPAGKSFSFGHPSVESVANRFLKQNPPQAQEDSSTHTLEAQYWRVRINELNQQCDEFLRQLEAEKDREKALQKLKKARENRGWWEVPSEELNFQELQQMNESLKVLHKVLCARMKEKTIAGLPSSSSSSSSTFLADFSAQGTTPFAPNTSGTNPSSFPSGYGCGQGHFRFYKN